MNTECSMKNIGWSLGNYCNARCKHCYSWKVRQSNNSLTKDEIDTIIKKVKEIGVQTLNLGGNEPIYTNGPDIKDSTLPYILEEIVNKGMAVGVTTNGITAVILEREYPKIFTLVNDWDISLDSPFEKEHNENRGGNLYDVAMQALKITSKHGVPKSIIVCGMNWNLDKEHLDGFLRLAQDYNSELRINTLKPTEPHHFKDLPSPKQYFEAFSYLTSRTEPVVMGESILAPLTGNDSYGCPCGLKSMRIHSKTADGKVPISPCVYLHDYKVGDLLKDDLVSIINSEQFNLFRKRIRDIPSSCKNMNCSIIDKCRGGCAARTILITKNIESRDPYCPIDYSGSGEVLPEFQIRQAHHDGMRVHENYLCTWIGKPRRSNET